MANDMKLAGGSRAATWQGALMVGLLALGAWQGAAALSTEAAQQRLRPTLDFAAFVAGRTAAAVNYVMAHQLPADPALRAAGGVFRWRLFGSGGPQVRVGCDDWLYLTEELRPWPEAEARMEERAAALGRIAARLRQRGIALAIAVTPDKARVHPEHLCGAPLSAQARARHDAWFAALRRHGVEATDLLPPLRALAARQPAYWRTDTHWNQEGAATAAQAIAEAARGIPLARATAFRTTAGAEANGPGDLLRLMSLDRMPDGLRPAPDRQRPETTEAAAAPAASGGLLDEGPVAEVVLLGSSYAVNANFHGRLQEALRSEVGQFARAGGGFAGAAREYFASPAYRETPPKLVVWEIPERVVAQPMDQAERDFLAGW